MTHTFKRALLAMGLAAALLVTPQAQSSITSRLHRAIQAAGVAIIGVSIGDPANKATWKVQPTTLQSAAQPTIDAFDPTVTGIAEELDAQVKAALDQERLTSAIVWTIIDTYSPPATITKYQAARTKIVNAYKNRPWIP